MTWRSSTTKSGSWACAVTTPKRDAGQNGDAFAVFRRTPDGSMMRIASSLAGPAHQCLQLCNDQEYAVAVVDGLGHGPEAAKASARVLSAIETAIICPMDLPEIIRTAHEAALETRGVVIGLATLQGNRLSFAGVGDILAELGRATRVGIRETRSLPSCPGVVGYQLPSQIDTWSTTLHPDDILVLCSDGISPRFTLQALELNALDGGAKACRDTILERFQDVRDDATVLVVASHSAARAQ